MNNKIKIIILLSILLAVLSTLFILSVGTSYRKSILEEEIETYENRMIFKNLNTPTEEISYALGMNYSNTLKSLLGLSPQNNNEIGKNTLATIYYIFSNPRLRYYYMGQTCLIPNPLNYKDFGIDIDYPLDIDYFIAGLAHSITKKGLFPGLSGESGQSFLQIAYYQVYAESIRKKLDELEIEEVKEFRLGVDGTEEDFFALQRKIGKRKKELQAELDECLSAMQNPKAKGNNTVEEVVEVVEAVESDSDE